MGRDDPLTGTASRHYARQDSSSVALKGRCPRCGQGKLFKGLLSFRDQCAACGFDFAAQDEIGDGPVVPVMMLANLVVLGFALWLHFGVGVPWWFHLIVTVPLAFFVVIGLTRYMKAWLFAQQYRHQAAQGRVQEKPNI